MQRLPAKHRALGRSIAELDARNPSLVDTPLPLNSVPVVGPLVSPLIGNGGGGSSQPSTPTPTSGSGGGSRNGGGNGNDGGSGNGGGNGNGGGSGDGGGDGIGGEDGNSGGDSSEGDSSGGGDGNPGGVNGEGNPPPPIGSPSSSGQATPVPSVPNPTSPSSPGRPSGSSSAKGTSSSGSPSSPGVGASFQAPPVNAALGPPANSLTPGGASAAATEVLSPSQYSRGSASQPVGTSSPVPTAAAVSSGKQLSGGGIVGIAIACLLLLLVLAFLAIRRRSIARRLELRRQWWFSRSGPGHNFSFLSRRSPRSTASSGEVPPSRLSARSSFATNFDQGLMFRFGSPTRFSLGLGLTPDLPPMAEVRERNCALVSTGASVACRESMNSMLSTGSDPDAQYLTVSGQNNLEPSTPMSVRPFSPSESFAFPKPPAPSSSTVESFFVSGTPALVSPQSSATTLVHLSTPPRAFISDLPIPTSASLYSTPNIQFSPFAEEPSSPVDPFADPAKPDFSEVEVVRRPFAPSLDDELAVYTGDRVRILRVFDDGWAFVEKVTDVVGEGRQRGLIPVDCFRQVDKPLPTFLAEKRVSYASEKLIAYAL